MIKHIILWQIKEGFSDDEKADIKAKAKTALEALQGVVPGLESIAVHCNGLASSNADLMLDSALTDPAALQAYQVHPAHQAAANTYIRPFMQIRLCLDYEA